MKSDEQIIIDRRASYLAQITNSVGSETYKNLYVIQSNGEVVDILQDGVLSCALFVSSLLMPLGLIKMPHATVLSTVKDLLENAWSKVDTGDIALGDILVWDKTNSVIGTEHIGFYVGSGLAVSNSSSRKFIAKHDMYFGSDQRAIRLILRCSSIV